jgi:hypothetical protein
MSKEPAMWQKATCYKSATFAACVVGSSLALLMGAQAASLNFTPGTAVFAGPPTSGTVFILNNTSTASFNGSAVGTASFVGPGGGSLASVSVGGFDPTTSTYNTIGMPNTSTLTVTSPGGATGNLLTGNMTITSIQDNVSGTVNVNSPVILMGNFTETGGSGPLADAFAPGGTFDFPVISSDSRFPSVTIAFTAMGFSGPINVSFTPLAGATAISPVPLPPALYLFGSVLGGAFWLGRKKRSAVSGLGAA